jgi:hypothetical protein
LARSQDIVAAKKDIGSCRFCRGYFDAFMKSPSGLVAPILLSRLTVRQKLATRLSCRAPKRTKTVNTNQNATSAPPVPAESELTKRLLACGAVAGPIYVIVGLIQILIRPGFDIRRHALSLMSNGDLGWIQIANFVVTGLLVVAGAAGIRRAIYPGRASTWGPLLLGLYGAGLILAGVFVADPALGFPPGTPEDARGISGRGVMHFIAGAIGFFGLIAACFVFTRRFVSLHQWAWALYSFATGAVFMASFFGIASGSGKAWIILAFYGAVVLAWAWISAISLLLILEISPKMGSER